MGEYASAIGPCCGSHTGEPVGAGPARTRTAAGASADGSRPERFRR